MQEPLQLVTQLMPKAKIQLHNMAIFQDVCSLQVRRQIIPQTAHLNLAGWCWLVFYLSTFFIVIVTSVSDTQHGWCLLVGVA